MFHSEENWDTSVKNEKLSDELFGEVVVQENKVIQKSSVAVTTNDPSEKLTREQWRRRQKNKRRAKKRSHAENCTDNTNDGALKNSNRVELVVEEPTITAEGNSVNLKTKTPCDNLYENLKKQKKNKRKSLDNPTFGTKTCEAKICKTDFNDANQKTNEQIIDKQKVGSLQEKLMNKLTSSRFRFINEQMYSSHSKETIKLFESDPQAFSVYHKGYLNQVSKWPVKPLDLIISWVKARSPKLVIADFGCGEAFLAQNVKNVVHSFDLVSVNKFVTVADISKVPLESQSVDVAVFCLSLMGTNFVEFLLEANRVLKIKAVLKIAEVASRFRATKEFVLSLKKLGFDLIKKVRSRKFESRKRIP